MHTLSRYIGLQNQQKTANVDPLILVTGRSIAADNEIAEQLNRFLSQLNETHIESTQQQSLIQSSFEQIFHHQQSQEQKKHADFVTRVFYPKLKQQFLTRRVRLFWTELDQIQRIVMMANNNDHVVDEQMESEVDSFDSLTAFFNGLNACLNRIHSSMSIYLCIVDCIQKNFVVHSNALKFDAKNDFMSFAFSMLFSPYRFQFNTCTSSSDGCVETLERNSLTRCMGYLLNVAFDSFCYQLRKTELEEQGEEIDDEEEPPPRHYKQVLEYFRLNCIKLRDMGMSSSISVGVDSCLSACLRFIQDTVQKKIEESFAEQFEEESLSVILSWLEVVILPFLQIFLNEPSVDSPLLEKMKLQVELFIYTSLTRIRIHELFDIIKHYPDSKPALIDLKHCLIRTGLHSEMVTCLKRSISKRLIIPGAKTIQIISQFINIIKAVSIIDPTGVTLKYVSEEVKNYLTEKRPDTVKCLISELIDQESNSDLYQELLDSDPQDNLNYDSDDADEWNPSPIYADPSSTQQGRKPYPDIIKLFVEMFKGNKELFLTEYRAILSDRLLAKGSYETNDEARTLEMLKIRFGEKALQLCEVMVKDVSDSKFINNNIHKKYDAAFDKTAILNDHPSVAVDVSRDCIDTFIISRPFWPTDLSDGANTSTEEDGEPKLHPIIVHLLEQYEKQFKMLKAPRRLIWLSELGKVSFTIEIGEQEVDIEANPIASSVLLYFCDQDAWSIADLAKVMDLDSEHIEKKIIYWVMRGFLQRDTTNRSLFRIVEELNGELLNNEPAMDQLEEVVEETSRPNGYDSFAPIIMNMLRNMEVMPIDKIHNMLRLFAQNPKYDKTMQELGFILNELVQEGLVDFDSGLYRIIKK